MELNNEFRVGVPVEQAWNTLTDIEFIVPCLPGAQLTEIDEDGGYKGQVKVKVGPITAQYKGIAKFVERDADSHRFVLEASGRDSRGAGNASAQITAMLTPDGDETDVSIGIDLKITGKVAQFGRGVLADVSEKLMNQFAESLQAKLADALADDSDADADEAATAAAATSDDQPKARQVDMPEPEPVDLLAATGVSRLKKLLAPVVALLALLLLRRRRRRRRSA